MQLQTTHQEILEFEWGGSKLQLHPDKGMYIPDLDILLISDLHLGKTDHFRKYGVGVPLDSNKNNYSRLSHMIHLFNPGEVIFLGDLFHSSLNAEWNHFKKFINQYRKIKFRLVIGNHDILDRSYYLDAGLHIHEECLQVGNFLLTHYPQEEINSCHVISGHLHPAIRMRGRGKQGLRIPCFFFRNKQSIIPAFGVFTGTATLKIRKGDILFGIVERKIIPLSAAN